MTCQLVWPNTRSGGDKSPTLLQQEERPKQRSPFQPQQASPALRPSAQSHCSGAPRPGSQTEGKSPQGTPTCGAVRAHSADRKEDIGVAMEHLQRGPAVHLGEVGVHIQRPEVREHSCVTHRRASDGSEHHEHPPASLKFLLGNQPDHDGADGSRSVWSRSRPHASVPSARAPEPYDVHSVYPAPKELPVVEGPGHESHNPVKRWKTPVWIHGAGQEGHRKLP